MGKLKVPAVPRGKNRHFPSRPTTSSISTTSSSVISVKSVNNSGLEEISSGEFETPEVGLVLEDVSSGEFETPEVNKTLEGQVAEGGRGPSSVSGTCSHRLHDTPFGILQRVSNGRIVKACEKRLAERNGVPAHRLRYKYSWTCPGGGKRIEGKPSAQRKLFQ